ncbi:MAG: peptidoglycan-binding protein [Acidobacteriaceae bacterium]|nr:peptidoglycan-binding protein [Acidobacteriaceae bacterium]
MLSARAWQCLFVAIALSVTPALANRTHRAPTAGHSKSASHKTKKSHVVQGQRGIDPDRAREIQTALIREHYLTGTPSGQWDPDTETAMQKYQADHGWQTKLTPDSRAIIMLGLGPAHKADAAQTGSKATTSLPNNPTVSESNTLASTHSIQN